MKLLILFLLGLGSVYADCIEGSDQCLYTCGCMKHYGDSIELRLDKLGSEIISNSSAAISEQIPRVVEACQPDKLVDSLKDEVDELKNFTRTEFELFKEHLSTEENRTQTESVRVIVEEIQKTQEEYKTDLDTRLIKHHDDIVTTHGSQINESVDVILRQLKVISEDIFELKTSKNSSEVQVHRRLKEAFERLHDAVNAGHKPVFLPSGKIIVFPKEVLLLAWRDGKKFCSDLRMSLVTTKDQTELDEYHGAAKKIHESTAFWLSASNIDEGDANFKWQDGTPLPYDSNLWYPERPGVYEREPDDYKTVKEACVFINTKYKEKLHDVPCAFTCSVVCEL